MMSSPKTAAAALVAAGIAMCPLRAAAEPVGTFVVSGKASAHEKTTLESGIAAALRRASWTLSAQPFSPKESDTITTCMRDDKPWHCLSAVLGPRGVARVIVVETTKPDAPDKLTIVGEFVIDGDGSAAVAQRRCDACDDAHLSAIAEQLVEELLQDMEMRNETVLAISAAPGTLISLDGQPIGAVDATGTLSHPTLPGPHQIAAHHPGYVDASRQIELPVAKTTPLSFELAPAAESTTPSRVVPIVVGVVGAAAIGTGLALQLEKGPAAVNDDQPRHLVSVPGIVLMSGGAAAVAIGAYLFVRASTHQATPTSMPVASLTPGGAIAGWQGHF